MDRFRDASTLSQVLFAFGYPTAIVVIARWVPVVRQRRTRWFVLHTVAVAAIVTGWIIEGDTRGAVINGTWLVVSTVWWVLAGRRAAARAG
jgi:hypothetical protein